MSDVSGFDVFERDVVETIFAHDPIGATMAGRHDRDAELGEYSLSAYDSVARDYRALLTRLDAMPPTTLSPARRIDAALLRSTLETAVVDIEEIRSHRTNPAHYAERAIYSVYFLLIRDHLPLPERVKSMAARLAGIPDLLETGLGNLADVPPLFAEVGMQIAEDGGEFMNDVIAYVAERNRSLVEKIGEPARNAQAAFRAYARSIQADVLPKARGSFVLGKKLLDWLFRHEHLLPQDSEEIARRGRAIFEETRRLMEETAREIDPTAGGWHALIEQAKSEMPEPARLLELYTRDVEACRQFIEERDLAPIPAGEVLRIVETPLFERSTIPYAAYQPPGPFESVQEGFFYVTPVDLSMSAEEQRDRLQGHNRTSRLLTALHEAYPGHHLQLMHANRTASLSRKLADSSVLAEGWALYCEQMMWEEGFYTDKLTRLWQLKDALWRAARIIVDTSLHTGAMGFDDAVEFLVREVLLERANAIAEVKRYCMSPTQPSSYMLGKLAILDMREEAKKRAGAAFRLGEFHARLLGAGTLPVPLVRAHVLEEEAAVPA
jgi:uncharacterized protein (DUF885 family)